MARSRRRHPATASRILAAGVAVGTAGAGVAFMAVNDPTVLVKTVTAPPAPPPRAKVIVFEVQHRPAAAPTGAPSGSSAPIASRSASRSTSPSATGANSGTAAVPAPAPAPAAAPAPPAPAAVTTTGPS